VTLEQMGERILDQANEIAALKKALMIAEILYEEAVQERNEAERALAEELAKKQA
jgi:hypothetical protein